MDMISVTADPVSVSSFRARAKGSTMKLSPNRVIVPLSRNTKNPASARKRTAAHRMSSACSLRVETPTSSNTMAPVAKVSSGSATDKCKAGDTVFPYGSSATRACPAAASAV